MLGIREDVTREEQWVTHWDAARVVRVLTDVLARRGTKEVSTSDTTVDVRIGRLLDGVFRSSERWPMRLRFEVSTDGSGTRVSVVARSDISAGTNLGSMRRYLRGIDAVLAEVRVAVEAEQYGTPTAELRPR